MSFQVASTIQIGNMTLMPSSFIKGIEYDTNAREMTVYFKNGTSKTYKRFAKRTVLDFMRGKAVCITNDPTGKRRWFRGKTPSMGAYFNQFIRKLGRRVARAPRLVVKGEKLPLARAAKIDKRRTRKKKFGGTN